MTCKTYVLDTNVLLSDPNSIFSFQEHELIIPMAVLEELDRHKSRPDEVGRNARQVSRTLDEMRQNGGSLVRGVALPEGGKLRIDSINQEVLKDAPAELQALKVDNLIIAFMLSLKKTKAACSPEPILVSKDINVRIKCDSLDIKCEDYRKMRATATTDPQKFYRGVEVLEMEEELVDYFYQHGNLDVPESVLKGRHLYPNQIVVIKNVKDGQTTKSAIAKVPLTGKSLVPVAKIDSAFGLKPRNKEQSFSLDLLFDENIKLLTLVGPSGTGKTLLALAAALDQLKGLGNPALARYNKLIVTRPVQPVGKDIGFLPGTLEEKMEPWIAPIRDNLNFLMGSKRSRPRKNAATDRDGKPKQDDGMYLSLMQDRGLIEIEAITFIRGRSIPNAFIVIDEAQNLSMHELKTIITRVGDGTKIVLTGDIEQIDNVHVDAFTNGLTYAVERFKEHGIAGHVTLIKGERSELATLASKIL
jgi:PhoH-like ATPase